MQMINGSDLTLDLSVLKNLVRLSFNSSYPILIPVGLLFIIVTILIFVSKNVRGNYQTIKDRVNLVFKMLFKYFLFLSVAIFLYLFFVNLFRQFSNFLVLGQIGSVRTSEKAIIGSVRYFLGISLIYFIITTIILYFFVLRKINDSNLDMGKTGTAELPEKKTTKSKSSFFE